MNSAYHVLRGYDLPSPTSVYYPSSSLVREDMSSSAVADAAPCLIPEKCLKNAKRNLSRDMVKSNILGCESTFSHKAYFRCVCAQAQSLGNNEYFSAHCVLKECTDARKKKGEFHISKTGLKVNGKLRSTQAFIKLYQDGCKQLGTFLADIPDEWAPYAAPLASTVTKITPTATQQSIEGATTDLSSSLLNTPVTTTTTVLQLSPNSPPVPPPKHASSTAIIAGSTVSAAVLLALLISLLKLYWSTKKKAKKLQVANAQLQDATNPDGVSQRISALMSGVSAPSAASDHVGVVTSAYSGKEMCDRDRGAGTPSGTVGFPYPHDEPVGYESDKRGWCASYSTSCGGVEGVRDVRQGSSNDMPDIGDSRRISEYSESDYGSTRRRSWEELLASGAQEVRPLRVERKGVWYGGGSEPLAKR